MTEFAFRQLLKAPYRDVVERLDRVAAGESAALEELLGSVRAALSDPALHHRNARSSQLRFWSDWLETALPAGSATALNLGEIAVATLCLPDFQFHPLAGEEPSPSLVVLGDSDGGLFGVLTERIPWFEAWLIEGLGQRQERFGYGRNMFQVSDQDAALLASSLGLEAHCRGAPQPEYCRATLAHLSTLLATALSRPEWGI